ncbi:MAG: hypothetical protein JWQ71_3256 [Pedosphaera sp.]|nr:hypothetical protein [Pedosphaera sp.]
METTFLKGLCKHCHQSIDFPQEYNGQKMQCPHCGKETYLIAPAGPLPGTPLAKDFFNKAIKAEKSKLEMQRLIPCKDCGHQVSRNAEVCPNCGCVFEGKNARVFRYVFVGILSLLLTSIILWVLRAGLFSI